MKKFKITVRKKVEKSNKLVRMYRGLANIKYYVLRIIPDKYYIPLMYKIRTGQKIDIQSPTTLSDKVNWLKLHYKDSKLTYVTDKVSMRDYVESLGLHEYLVPIVGVYRKSEEIPYHDLKDGKTYYIKTNHDSGTVIQYNSKNKHNDNEIKKYLKKSMKNNYYYRNREWNYKNIDPKIIIENNIKLDKPLLEFKLFCFHGEPEFSFVYEGVLSETGVKKSQPKKQILDMNLKETPFIVGEKPTKNTSIKINRQVWKKAQEIARLVAEPFPFVRVDFLWNGEQLYLGELTFYSSGGNFIVTPQKYNEVLGTKLTLPPPN